MRSTYASFANDIEGVSTGALANYVGAGAVVSLEEGGGIRKMFQRKKLFESILHSQNYPLTKK